MMFSLSVNMMQKYRKKIVSLPMRAEKEILVVRFYAYIHYCLVTVQSSNTSQNTLDAVGCGLL